jgi:hypothetical protein
MLTVVAVPLLCLAVLYLTPASYIYCTLLEQSWIGCKTKSQLERRLLCIYTTRQIDPKDSPWGHEYQLNNGERMIRYLIFNKEPLDVVYGSNDEVIVIFTSYE